MPKPRIPSRTVAFLAPGAVKLSLRRCIVLAALAFTTLATAAQSRPILIELFTSEGCSSCPPADALLAKIAGERKDVIVLSEHVDYWNSLGWTDPFSSTASTQRQQEYAQRFRGEGPYTPQMVVDGTHQFVGSNSAALRSALAASTDKSRATVTLTALDDTQTQALHIAIKLEAAPSRARLIAVLVQNEGHQEVRRGENGGRTLRHVGIAREFRDLGEVPAGHAFESQTTFKLPPSASKAEFHVVVFLQQGAGGPILGAATT